MSYKPLSDEWFREAISEAVKRAPERALQNKIDANLGIRRNLITGRVEQGLRPVFEREIQKKQLKDLEKILNRSDFEAFEHEMMEDADAARKRPERVPLQELETRMLITTAAERALFTNSCQLGRNKSNMAYFERLVWSAETPWRQQLQIDNDYAKYCVGLDNRPNFLSWCINQMHRKTTTLGATSPCVTRI